MAARPGLGDLLVEEGLIAREQLAQAQRAAERLGCPLVTVLLEQGLASEEALVGTLCRKLHLELYDPLQTTIDLDAIREVPFEEANRYRLLPVQLSLRGTQRVLRVAMVDPLDAQAIEDIEFSTASAVEPLVARASQLADAIRHHYRGVVTKIIPRMRPTEAVSSGSATGRKRIPLDEGRAGAVPGVPAEYVAQLILRLDALVHLLIRKQLITPEDYEEVVRDLLLAQDGPAKG
jgi:hypothetical protein